MSRLGRRGGDSGDDWWDDATEDVADDPWQVKRWATPPVIGWFDADTGEPYMRYYTGNEFGRWEPAAPSQSTVDLPPPVAQHWTDDDDGTEVRLTM